MPVLSLTMAAALVPGVAVRAEEASEFTYDAINQRLTDYNGAGGDVTVPAEVDGAVVEVMYGTFNSKENVTSISLPDTLKVLDSSSIYALTNLTGITLPEGLEIIGDYNFWLCDSLEELTIPSTVAYIGNNCFQDCGNLSSITFTGEVPFIGTDCFGWLSDNITIYVPDDQFEAYQAVLPSALYIETSGQNAVIADHTAPESDFEFDAATGTITAINSLAYYLDIPDTIGGTPVKAIGDAAAAQHTCNAYRITVPEGVESIGNEAFALPNHLVWVDLPSTLRSIGDSAFYFYMGYKVNFNEGLESIGTGAFESSSLYGELHLPAGLKTIAPEAFKGSFRITDVYFPDTIETIGANAFTGTGVTYLNFADTKLPEMDATAFEGLEIADVDMDWHTTMAEAKDLRAYFDSIDQDRATVWSNNPSSYGVASLIGYSGGDSLAAAYTQDDNGEYLLESYGGTVEDVAAYPSMDGNHVIGVGSGCFKDNQVLRSFYPHHCGWFTTIQDEAFAGSTLESIDMFDSITTIGDGGFRDCKNLTEITLSESLTSIGEGAFDGCDNLKKVNVQCSAEILPDTIFADCASLKENTEGILLAADVADDQIERISDGMGLPWYQPLLREGETRPELIAMPFTPTDAQYFELDAETGTITGYTGTDADVIVPRQIDGVEVKAIGYSAFENCRDYTNTDTVTNQTSWTPLRSIVLPETVTEIADSAFSYCQQLETFICYGPALSTGKGTFSNCKHLEQVIFVNGVGMIDNYAFENTDYFETFYSPVPMRYLGESAFLNSGVQEFVVDAASVGNSAFWNCGSLYEIHFTDHVKQVNAAVTNGCEHLYEVCFETTDLSFVPNDGIIAGTPGYLTVRVPEGTDEENLEKANHVLTWGTEDAQAYVTQGECDRTPAELPDIEAILQAYADDPYEAPDFPET